jgi:acetyl-CoA acetyltransferase
MAQKVYILDTSMIRFLKYPDRTVRELAQKATQPVLQRWKLRGDQIEAVVFSNSGWGRIAGQTAIRGEVALRALGIQGMPIINVENACASGSTALHVAYHRILAGASESVLVVGVEKIFSENSLMTLTSYLEGLDVEELPRTLEMAQEWIRQEGLDAPPPSGLSSFRRKRESSFFKRRSLLQTLKTLVFLHTRYGPKVFWTLAKAAREGMMSGDRSPFMDVYATAARFHMKKYGLTQRQLAIVAAKNRKHGSLNPYAQIQKEITVEEVLSEKEVSYPLTRPMCAPVGDGAAAAILCSEEFLKRQDYKGPKVAVKASVLVSGTHRKLDEPGDLAERAGKLAYEQAGLGPEDIHFAELHDATAFGEIHHSETLGFAPLGGGGALAESGETTLGGRVVFNPSGGLECRGHPVGATGIAQVHEVFEQLTGRAGKRQVEGARIALTENGGGNIGFEEAALAVHIFGND